MSQSTTSESISNSRVKLPERQRLLPTTNARTLQKLISLSKLKDLMHKSKGANLDDHNLSGNSIEEGSQDSSSLVYNGAPTGAHYIPLTASDGLAAAHANDKYSPLVRPSTQSKGSHIEGSSVEKTDDQCNNNLSDHHQSRAEAATLNQSGIRVAQQEFEQPQSRTATKRYNTNNVATNTNSTKKVESSTDFSNSRQDKRQEQLDQAICGGRKRKRIYSLQSAANSNDELYDRGTLNDKGIGPCRVDSRGRNNMTPSSYAFCQGLESIKRHSQVHSSFESYDISHVDSATNNNLPSPQSSRIEINDKNLDLAEGDNGVKSRRLNYRDELQPETCSRAPVSEAHGVEQATATISRSSQASSAFSSSLPTEDASQIKSIDSNTSVSHDRETNLNAYKQARESTSKHNFVRASGNTHLHSQHSRQTRKLGTESEDHNDNLRTASYSTSDSNSNTISRPPYSATNVDRFANDSHSDNFADQMIAASQQHSRIIGHNMNNLSGTRIPNYIIDRSNIRVSVSTTIENAGSLIAACDINQQQQAAIAPPSNECVADHNYNNYNLVTSSKSSSPNSISLTPSPKAHAMQTLAVSHHGSNHMIPSGLNHSAQGAMGISGHHLDHSNNHYNNGVHATPNHQHQINQQHYAYSQPTPSTGSTNHHPHHLSATNHEQSTYGHLQQQQLQQQQQQQQQQHQQLQQQNHQQHQHNQQHQQHQQAQQQSISNQQFIYNQIANGAAVGPNHGYANVANNAHYHSQLQSSNNQANNLMSEVHQSHLNTAATAAAQAAAAVVSQTLKTVAHQHNHNHHQHYGNSIATGFNGAAGLMNMTTQHHPQFHGVNSLAQHHPTHHLGHNHVSVMGIQPSQQQQSHLQQAPSLSLQQSNHSIVTRKYQCRMCPQVFMSKAEMKYHNQNHLREAKPYKCLQCPKAFANSSYLSQHMRIHQGLKPYACDICSRKFTQLSHLQQHKRTHTGDKPYKCNYMNCTKQFSQLSNLQSHSRCHQLDKPYKCNSCYKCFHDEQSLLEHIPRHLESKHLKRNLCIFCGSSYQQERGLVKHFQQYHTDKSPTLVTAAIAAGTTGNTSLIASLVSSTQSKFATPSSGSTTSSISSNSSCSSSTISNNCQLAGQNGNTSGNINIAHTNSSGAYQVGSGFH